MLSSISIRGFKAITKELKLNNLAPINYLIGPNGSGKSSVLEGIFFIFNDNLDGGSHELRQKPLDFQLSQSETFIKSENSFKYSFYERSGLVTSKITDYKVSKIQIDRFIDSKESPNSENDILAFARSTITFLLSDKNYRHDIEYNLYNKIQNKLPRIGGDKEFQNLIFNSFKMQPVKNTNLLFSLKDYFYDEYRDDLFSEEKFNWLKNNYTETISKFIDFLPKDTNFKLLRSYHNKISQLNEEIALADLSEGTLRILSLLYFEKKISDYIVNQGQIFIIIEEPENQIHPNLQKNIPKIIEYIKTKHSNKNLQFLISTHSPFIINSALELDRENFERFEELKKKIDRNETEENELKNLSNENGNFKPTHKVYHLEGGTCKNPEGISATDFSISGFDGILSSIGVQPSDLLFANGVIWVEGPSDAIYIEKWLEMYALSIEKKIYKPGFDFQFQMYGGTILKFYTDRETTNQEKRRKLTDIFKINTRAFMVMDSDINSNGVDKSTYKKEKELILSEFNSISSDKVGIWHDTCVSTIECYTPNYEYHDWWKNHHNQNHWSEYKNKDWKNEYAYRLVNLWSKKLKSEKGEIWDQYLKTLSNEAKTGLEKYIKSLYATIQSWNEPK
jgi:predicted ATP-dependent endonuclease of OLD family